MADTLKTDYVDDVLDTSINTNRKYKLINNADGTVSFEDVTEYLTNGDNYGAKDINEQNTFINNLKESFSQALADLRNTAIAQAVGVVASDTFAQIVTKLGAIVNRGKVTKALTGGETYTIPQGYHDGTGTVSAPAQTGTYSATTNGTHDMGATNTYRYVSVSVPTALSYYTQQNYAQTGTKNTVSVSVIVGVTYVVVRMCAVFGSGSNRWSKANFSGGTIIYDYGIKDAGKISFRAMIVKATGATFSYSGVSSEDTESQALWVMRIA